MAPDPGQRDLRERMAVNADPRALRTRRRVVDAYRRLGGGGHEQSVSVTEIARAAGVTRSAFYAHFSGPSAVAVAALTEIFEVVASLDSASRLGGGEDPRQVSERSLHEVIGFVAEHRARYVELLAARDEFVLALEDAFADSVLRTLHSSREVSGEPEVTARFVAAGAMGVIAWWLRERPDLTPEELARDLTAVIPSEFTRRAQHAPTDKEPDHG